MQKILTVSCLLLLSSASSSQTLLLGVSQFTSQNNGIWYQEGFPYSLSLTSGSIGIRVDKGSYSFGYIRLGSVFSNAVATASDDNYNAATRGCNGECWPLSHWYGKGSVQGIFGSLTKQFGVLTVEGGLYLYQPRWEVRIPDWISCKTCAPIDLRVEHNAKWQLGPMLGLRWQITKALSLNLSTWHTQSEGDEWSSLYRNQTTNLSLGVLF